MTTIKLLAPKGLPEEGLTSVAFEAWQNQTISFLEQEVVNYFFISGIYSTWLSKQTTQDGRRISKLDAADPDKLDIESKSNPDAETAKQGELQQLLLKRNSQLTKCLQLVANLCQYSEQSDVMNCSTSLSWVWDYLKKHYNIESRGSHFLGIAAINPRPDQKPIVFYKQFRAGFINNLRKANDTIVYKDNLKLTEDEKISPTFECTIMLWALEKLDPRLPSKVQKDFGFRMEGNTTLIELQTAIFQAVPGMIEELNEAADARAVYLGEEAPDIAVLAAMGGQGGRGRGRVRGRGRGVGQRLQGRAVARGGQQATGGVRQNHCRVCKLAGKSDAVVRSHTIGQCYFFTKQDQADLLANLNTMETNFTTGPDSPYYQVEEDQDEEQD